MTSNEILRVAFFTENGKKLCDRLMDSQERCVFEIRDKSQSLEDFVRISFEGHLPILFIGAAGIAVRAISPFVKDKLSDSCVLVTDELGKFVIPLLSGHYGKGIERAKEISKLLGAVPVITTATDINGVFSVDVFAVNNGLHIVNKDLIKKVSSKALKGEELCLGKDFCITDNPEEENSKECLLLKPKRVVLGMGCKKGKTFEELKDFVLSIYDEDYLRQNLYAICSIDVKARETGLIKLAFYFGAEFITYSKQELLAARGEFEESDFVKDTVGVGNVCERAAICGAGEGSELILKKTARDGMTIAGAKRGKIDLIWQER
ncbi:MAG: cobalamin biosynthesis protein [Butyrivibrio sp.]|nr:cobalamin biosynthesis protein [Butyrivibrio sp.]